MNVYGELKRAQGENLSSDPTALSGRVYWHTTRKLLRVYDGTVWGNANRFENKSSDPASPNEGDVVWRTDLKRARIYNGASWDTVALIGSGSVVSVDHTASPYTMTGLETHIEIDATAGDVLVTLPDRAANVGVTYPIDRIDGAAHTVIVQRAGADTIAEPVDTTSFEFEPYRSQDFYAGVTKWKVRG